MGGGGGRRGWWWGGGGEEWKVGSDGEVKVEQDLIS